MVRYNKPYAPYWSLIFLFFLSSCGQPVSSSDVANPYANLTGQTLGFDVTPPTFETDASGQQEGMISASPGTCGSILLRWALATDDVTLTTDIVYYIYQSTSPRQENLSAPTYQSPAGVVQYLVTNLSPSQTYYFVVRARDQAGNLSVVDPSNLVERYATVSGPRSGGPGPNLYCPGGYAGESAILTGTSIAGTDSALFQASPSPVMVPTTILASNEVQALIPSGIQSGSIQISPSGQNTSDRFLFYPTGTDISNDPTTSTEPSIAISGSNVAIAWTDTFNGLDRILFSLSTDGGGSFSSPVVVSDPSRVSSSPQLVFGSGASPPIYLVWKDLDIAGKNSDIYFGSSLTNGSSFSTPVNLSLNAGTSIHPRIVYSGNSQNPLSVVWDDTSVMYGLTSVWGSTATFNDVYAVGNQIGQGGIIYHTIDQGLSWTKPVSNIPATLNAIWGSSMGDVYVVGSGGTILHSNNQFATTSILGPSTTGTPNNLNAIWGSSISDVYAVGDGGTILHFNGLSWGGPVSNIPSSIIFNGVWGSDSTDVYAVGSGGVIYHYDGSSWTGQTWPTGVNLNGIWGSSASDIYIAGDQGTILYSQGGGIWSSENTGITTALNTVWGTTYIDSSTNNQPEIVYAAGVGDKIIKKSGTYPIASNIPWNTSTVAVSGSFSVKGLWGRVISGESVIYGVQGNGPIFQWNGTNWQYLIPEATSGEVFYVQSSNGGANFTNPVTVSSATPQGHQALDPDLVQSGNNVVIAWSESQSGIHIVQSMNNGASFSPPNQVISPLQSSSYPQSQRLALSGNTVYLVWEDTSNSSYQVRLSQPFAINNVLSTFPSSQQLSASGTAKSPSVTFAEMTNTLVVVWSDPLQEKIVGNAFQNELFLMTSPDGGNTFTPPSNFSSPFQDASDSPILVNDGTNIFMAWEQQIPPTGNLPQNAEVFFSRF
ncbi:MAG: hypothetical protein ACHQYP_04455 [Nitrospiria bacterium]